MAGLSGNAYMLENFATIETKTNPINDNVNIIPVVCPRNRECLKKKRLEPVYMLSTGRLLPGPVN